MRDTRRHAPPLNGTPVDCHVAPDGLRSADMRLKIPQATGWGRIPVPLDPGAAGTQFRLEPGMDDSGKPALYLTGQNANTYERRRKRRRFPGRMLQLSFGISNTLVICMGTQGASASNASHHNASAGRTDKMGTKAPNLMARGHSARCTVFLDA